MELTKAKYELYPINDHVHSLVVKNPRLCKKVNQYLNHYYPVDTKFSQGEEVLFKVPNSKLDGILIILGVKRG